ncbi:MAG TPA: type II secretion system protein [Elainellaceae cyanobacterium]
MKSNLSVLNSCLIRLQIQRLQVLGVIASPSQHHQAVGKSVRRSAPEAGLTLLECLVAIAVIALTGAMVGPPLLLATATRIQNQRAEQALQIAQGEVDRVRSLVERGEHTPTNLPAAASGNPALNTIATPASVVGSLKSVSSTCSTYTGAQIPINRALQIDIDGDCQSDFLMQVFRTSGTVSQREQVGRNRPGEFDLMVRVYAAIAQTNLGNLDTEPASLRFTSGEGNQRSRPLAVLTTQITWSESDNSLFCYQELANCQPQ